MAFKELAELRKLAAELRDEFRTLADELDMHLRNVNIARVSGGVAGVVGGIIATAGIIAIPFTLGISAVVAGIGGSIAAGAGAVTVAGAKIAQAVIEGRKCKGVSEKWDNFRLRASRLGDGNFAQLEVDAPNLVKFLKMGIGAIGLAGGLETAALRGAGMAVGRAAGRVGVQTVAGSVLSVVLVGVSLYDIVDGAIEIHKKKKSKGSDVIRELARQLDAIAGEG